MTAHKAEGPARRGLCWPLAATEWNGKGKIKAREKGLYGAQEAQT